MGQLLDMAIDFSVIIPTFRRPRELLEAISSALSQQGVTVEVLVIDDSLEGSAEESVRGLRDSRVSYLRNPVPSGGMPSKVRNLGWPLASGTFVHFLDDDDVVAEGYYAAVKVAFESHPRVGLVFGRVEPFGSGPASQLEHERAYFAAAARKAAACRRFGTRWAYVGRMIFDAALLICSASVVKRRCVVSLGGFDPEIRLLEDADFHIRAMREFGAYFIDRTAVHYRIGSPSLMHSPNPSQQQLDETQIGGRRIKDSYRNKRGPLEWYALALFARTLLRIC
jgi:glycosyltransferase involved in cell wall biosynthesis